MSIGAPYALVLDDGNRHLSKRCGQSADCTVRSLAIVTGVPYDEVYEALAAAGRPSCQGFDSTSWLKRKRGKVFGGRFRAVPVRGLTPSTFPARHPKGRYLIELSAHVYSLIDGVAHDLWRVKEQPLSGAWVFVLDKRANRR